MTIQRFTLAGLFLPFIKKIKYFFLETMSWLLRTTLKPQQLSLELLSTEDCDYKNIFNVYTELLWHKNFLQDE